MVQVCTIGIGCKENSLEKTVSQFCHCMEKCLANNIKVFNVFTTIEYAEIILSLLKFYQIKNNSMMFRLTKKLSKTEIKENFIILHYSDTERVKSLCEDVDKLNFNNG